MPEGGIPDGWAIATNGSRGTFEVAGQKFQLRGLTRRQKRELHGESLNWATDTDFLVWALNMLRLDTAAAKKEVTADLMDEMDDAEVAELTDRLMIQLGFREPRAAAPA